MRQVITLKNEVKQLVQTISPEMLINLESGTHSVDSDLYNTLNAVWPMSDYSGNLMLEVENG